MRTLIWKEEYPSSGRPGYIFIALLALANLGWGNPAAQKVKEGNALYRQEKYDEALIRYNAAQQDLPNSPEIYFNIGDVQYRKGDYEKAGALFGKVAGADEKALQSPAFYNQGNNRYREGKLWEALAAYKKAIELNPKDQDAKFNYEFVALQLKEEEQKKEKEKKKKEEQPQKEQDAQPQPSPSPQPQPSPSPQPQQQEMSQEEAQRLLNALQSEEEEQRAEQQVPRFPEIPEVQKDW